MARGNSKRTDWSIFRWERSQHHSAIPTAIPAILDARRLDRMKKFIGVMAGSLPTINVRFFCIRSTSLGALNSRNFTHTL